VSKWLESRKISSENGHFPQSMCTVFYLSKRCWSASTEKKI